MQVGFVMGVGDENRLVGHERQPEKHRRIEISHEDIEIVLVVGIVNVIKQVRGVRPLLLHPVDLGKDRAMAGEQLVVVEIRAQAINPKTMDHHAVQLALSRRVDVGPRVMVNGAGRDHVHLGQCRQMLGHPAGQHLRPAVDFLAVTLHDHSHSLLAAHNPICSR